MKRFFFLLFFGFTVSLYAQIQSQSEPPPPPPPSPPNNLEPTGSIFSLYDFQFEYYSQVRKILFHKLSEYAEIRFLTMPSFTPESVLDIEFNREENKYFLIYHIGEEMIRSNTRWKNVKVAEFRKEIDQESAALLKSLFRTAILKSRYNDTNLIGLDGVTYYFSYFENGMKTGSVWSPPGGTNLGRLVDIGNELIELTKSADKKAFLNEDLKKEIVNLISNL